MASMLGMDGWEAWLTDYRAWLGRLGRGVAAGRAAADGVLSVYGLVARFGWMIDKAAALELARRKASLPEGLGDEEMVAIEAEIVIGLRLRMFAALGDATRAHYRALLESGEEASARLLAASNDSLERAAGLLRFHLNESAALEDFLLASLRIWTKR
jgi:DNA polymerase-3 subunit delta'